MHFLYTYMYIMQRQCADWCRTVHRVQQCTCTATSAPFVKDVQAEYAAVGHALRSGYTH